MGRTSIIRLERAYQQLQTFKVHISDYHESDAYDAVFSMTTAETFLAGIADTLLSGQAIPFSHRSIVDKVNVRFGTAWVMENGDHFDLSRYPQLVEWAKVIELVRVECRKSI